MIKKDERILRRYISVFENLNQNNLIILNDIFDENIFFKDPFNSIKGKKHTINIFKEMFKIFDEPRFSVNNYGFSLLSQNTIYLSWNLSGKFKKNYKNFKIKGLSEVTFNNEGKVISHIDHWDSLSQFLVKLPRIGFVINFIRRIFF